MTAVNKNTLWALIVFLGIAILIGAFYPKEEKLKAGLKIGSGSDISGIILEETVNLMEEKNYLVGAMEFGDC